MHGGGCACRYSEDSRYPAYTCPAQAQGRSQQAIDGRRTGRPVRRGRRHALQAWNVQTVRRRLVLKRSCTFRAISQQPPGGPSRLIRLTVQMSVVRLHQWKALRKLSAEADSCAAAQDNRYLKEVSAQKPEDEFNATSTHGKKWAATKRGAQHRHRGGYNHVFIRRIGIRATESGQIQWNLRERRESPDQPYSMRHTPVIRRAGNHWGAGSGKRDAGTGQGHEDQGTRKFSRSRSKRPPVGV